MEMFERHLPPSRQGSAGGHRSHAGDMGPLQSRQSTSLQQHRVNPGWGCQVAPLRTLGAVPGIIWSQGMGSAAASGRQLAEREGGRSFRKVPELDMGHDAKAPGLGKTPSPFVERRA